MCLLTAAVVGTHQGMLRVAVPRQVVPQQVAPSQALKPQKPFEDFSERGKQYRLTSLFTRTPEQSELNFKYDRSVSRQQLDFTTDRNKASDAALLFLKVNQSKNRCTGVYILENTIPPWGGGENISRCHLGEKI